MKNKDIAVIYARYSSERQNEQSIAGQVDVCKKWAEENNMKVIRVYHDEALTGRTDKRPDFQRMIHDAKEEHFQYVIVYKLDRFARNRSDSAKYRAWLRKCNVKLVSAMENISKGPEGIILESVLEGIAEYYSANLSQNVIRGMHQKAEEAKYLGGTAPFGYDINENNDFIVNKHEAIIVKQIFEMYVAGKTLKDIALCLNNKGYVTKSGTKWKHSSFHEMLRNEKYIGIYKYMDVVKENAIPTIVSVDLFNKVQEKLKHNKRCPASSKSPVDFHLTGKLFCGKCGENMVGDSGTSHTGVIHYYYTCLSRKKRRGCKKKSVRKEKIEKLVYDITIDKVLTDKNIKYIAKKTYEIYEKERHDTSTLESLKSSLKDVEKVINNMVSAIEQGLYSEAIKIRLTEAEERQKDLKFAIIKEEIKKPELTAEEIEFFLYQMKSKIDNSEDSIKTIIDTFVNAVYLYDDKIIITFNFTEGESLARVEVENIEKFGFKHFGCTMFILSEPLIFGIIMKLQDN